MTGNCYLCGLRGISLYQNLKDRIYVASGIWSLYKCSNNNCNLIWLSPVLEKDTTNKLYENYYTHEDSINKRSKLFQDIYSFFEKNYLAYKYNYRNIGFWNRLLTLLVYFHPGIRAVFDFKVRYIKSKPHASLLDVGCGNGDMLLFMKDLGWDVEGVDSDNVAVEKALNIGLKVSFGTLETVKYPDNKFDVITVTHTIEHIQEPLAFLKECHRILKDTGCLVIITPNSDSLGHRMFRNNWFHLDPPRHFYVYNRLSLSDLFGKSGFKTSRMFTTIRDANTVFFASRMIKTKGKYLWNEPRNCYFKLWSIFIQMFEWLLLKIFPFVGEEIVLIAKK